MSARIENRRRTFKRGRQIGGDIFTGRRIGKSPAAAKNAGTSSSQVFDNPIQIEEWFLVQQNKYQFMYGLGSFLKFKEEMIEGRLKNITAEIVKLDEDFQLSVENYLSILGEMEEEDKSMKSVLQEKLQEQLSAGYETKYNELIQKKQSYKMILRFLQNRRAFIVHGLQLDEGKQFVEKIVKQAKKIYDLYRGQKYRRIRERIFQLINTIAYTPSSLKNSFQLNCVITGPAGSGKTTMARELAKWYSIIGILTFDSFMENEAIAFTESGRANFIGEYTGQTAPKTIGVLYQSLEKTLFMDEAYSIAGCNFDRQTGALEPDAYGEEFVAELLRFMNDHKGMNAIIVAGYKNLMQKCFLERNEGLPRRFPENIDLPLASTDELFNIFLSGVVDKAIDTTKNAKDQVESAIKAIDKKIERAKMEDPSTVAALEAQKVPLTAQFDALKEREKSQKSDKVKYYTVMKPSFMMLHYDSTYHAIETLRKYLISIQYRLQLTNERTVTLDNIYSYTITTHVLINLLDSDVRRNLMRRHFYREVFRNEDVNLSFFKAQAGEMNLISDLCSKMIEPRVSPGDVAVDKCKEMDMLNTYFKDKNIKIDIYGSKTCEASVEEGGAAPGDEGGAGDGGEGGKGGSGGNVTGSAPGAGNASGGSGAGNGAGGKLAGAAPQATSTVAGAAAGGDAGVVAASSDADIAKAKEIYDRRQGVNRGTRSNDEFFEDVLATLDPKPTLDEIDKILAALWIRKSGIINSKRGKNANELNKLSREETTLTEYEELLNELREYLQKHATQQGGERKSSNSNKFYLEVLKADSQLKDFQTIINSFFDLEGLFHTLSNPAAPAAPAGAPGGNAAAPAAPAASAAPAAPAGNAGPGGNAGAPAANAAPDPELELRIEEAKEAIPELLQTELMRKRIAEGANVNAIYEASLGNAEAISRKHKTTLKPREADKPLARHENALPSLGELYRLLVSANKKDDIINHVLKLYLEKNSLGYVKSIMERIETDFPVHLKRPEVEGEFTILSDATAHAKIKTGMDAVYDAEKVGRSPDSLENPKQRKLAELQGDANKSARETLISDLLWEDFGFY